VERPPTSGPGSGVGAWREYAAAVTGSPVESWGALSREDIIAQLDADGVDQADEQPDGDDQADVDEEAESGQDAPAAPRRTGPVWMVPTPDGMVPEHELRRR
jgi:hypothetical protein